jgi:hypothetical protein
MLVLPQRYDMVFLINSLVYTESDLAGPDGCRGILTRPTASHTFFATFAPSHSSLAPLAPPPPLHYPQSPTPLVIRLRPRLRPKIYGTCCSISMASKIAQLLQQLHDRHARAKGSHAVTDQEIEPGQQGGHKASASGAYPTWPDSGLLVHRRQR